MKHIKKLALYMPVFTLVLSVATVPVYARHGEDDSSEQTVSATSEPGDDSGSDDGVTSDDTSSDDSGHQTRTRTQSRDQEQENESEHEDEFEHEFRLRGLAFVKEAKKHHKVNTDKVRKNVCERRKHGIETRSTVLVKNANKHQDRITSVLDKATTYQSANNVQIASFDSLVAAANAAKDKSAASIAAMESLEPALDCTDANVAGEVATFKEATAQARTDLQSYKKTVKEVLVALVQAKDSGEDN